MLQNLTCGGRVGSLSPRLENVFSGEGDCVVFSVQYQVTAEWYVVNRILKKKNTNIEEISDGRQTVPVLSSVLTGFVFLQQLLLSNNHALKSIPLRTAKYTTTLVVYMICSISEKSRSDIFFFFCKYCAPALA